MNKLENAYKAAESMSSLFPEEISVMVKLAKLAFDVFKENDNQFNTLYKNAFNTAVDNAKKLEQKDSILKLLNYCKDIHEYENVANLPKYLEKIANECELYVSQLEISDISDKIENSFNSIILKDKYDMLYKFSQYSTFSKLSHDVSNLQQDISTILNHLNNDKQLKTDNKLYARSFMEPLCMHRIGYLNISLRDIFVIPKVDSKTNVLEVISDFILGNDNNVLFIEGYGGYGKSSLVSFIAYNYIFNHASPNISFLSNKQLITVRLRDIQNNNKISGIEQKLNNMDEIEDDAVFIFDGLDELCMIEEKNNGTTISESIINHFLRKNRKIIITSRPTYIEYYKFNLNSQTKHKNIELCSFDDEQRKELTDSFYQKDQRYPNSLEYVRNLPEEKRKNNSIYGSPFLLYLIMSGDIEDDEKDNSWKLMHRLFYKELADPQYDSKSHRISDEGNKELIYQLNCDIAYEMFKTKNLKLYVTQNDISQLLNESDNMREYLKKSHGLYSYMKRNNTGAIEFAHNHIRDYFLCEKILREIDSWYKNSDVDGYTIALNLCDLLQYSFFTDETEMFIKEALSSHYYQNILKNFNQPLSDIFDWFNKSGGALKYDVKKTSDRYIIISTFIMDSATYIYKNIYIFKYKIKNGEYITWFSEECIYPKLLFMMKNHLEYAELSNLTPVLINKYTFSRNVIIFTDIKSFDLSCAYLRNADLTNAYLIGANLKEADLSETNLTEADLTVADLTEADLTEADLTKANLNEADLTEADLTKANLNEADLTEADLTEADLTEADLTKTDLSYADLSHAKNIEKAKFHNTYYNNETKFPSNFKINKNQFIKLEK